jgi:hypothetical protein
MTPHPTRPIPVRPWHAKRKPLAVGDQPVVRTQRGARSVGALNKPRSVFSNLSFLSILGDMLAVIVAITTSFTVVVVGTLPVAEGLMLALLPVILVVRGKRLNRPIFRTVFALLALWLANQVFTDFYRQTAAKDWLRGNAAIVFFLVDLTFLVMLLGGNQRRKTLFVASYAIGSLLAARFQPTELAMQEPWKFGYSNGLTILSVLAAAILHDKRKYPPSLFILACITGANLLENYRSPVLNILVAVALTMPLIPERVGTVRLLPRKGTKARIAFLVVTALAAGVLAQGLVQLATSGGLVSEDAQVKNRMQSQSRGGLLIAGRPEILVSSAAVIDHPIVGLGSWARDFKYVEMLNDIQVRFGIPTDLYDTEQDAQGLIPVHSHIMGAWVWAGILGAAFWAYILWITFKGIQRLAAQPRPSFLHAWFLPALAWAILFSPFGMGMRIVDSLEIILICDLLSSAPGVAPNLQIAPARQFVGRRLAPPRRSVARAFRTR